MHVLLLSATISPLSTTVQTICEGQSALAGGGNLPSKVGFWSYHNQLSICYELPNEHRSSGHIENGQFQVLPELRAATLEQRVLEHPAGQAASTLRERALKLPQAAARAAREQVGPLGAHLLRNAVIYGLTVQNGVQEHAGPGSPQASC